MNKITLLIFFITTPMIAQAKENPLFGKNLDNSIYFYTAQGTGSGTLLKLIAPNIWDLNRMTVFMLQYSQPTTFFRLPARQSLHFVQNVAYGSETGLSFNALGISIDASVFDRNGYYIGFGLGPYMRNNRDRWVDSRLVFGEKFFIGKSLSDRWSAEFFTIHFSNGNFTDKNSGFNFAGFSIGYSF
ncbi:MAG: acyloxyacyl hydrolase [Alphaproteobacteria bacterium]|nr:acyloxyacyl hydrolase [Alphaproteobacteria bacterium]MBN2675542.1 acyloxyacyl hydrolase [Alphaproteobacteria bacterium]